jgi:hypothetical protein
MFERTRSGMAVLSRDGAHVGRVVDVRADGIVIEKGLIFHRDFLVPFSDIAQFRGDELVLSRDKASLRGARLPHGEQADDLEHVPVGTSVVDHTETLTPAAVARQSVPVRVSMGAFAAARPPEQAMHERRAAGPGGEPMRADTEEEPPERSRAPRLGPEDGDSLTRY